MSYKKTLGDFIADGALDLSSTNFYVVIVREDGQYEVHAQIKTDYTEAVAAITKNMLTPDIALDELKCASEKIN